MQELITRLQQSACNYSETEHLVDTAAIISRETYLHCLRVMGYAALICAQEDTLEEFYKQDIAVAALLHDIGKIRISPVLKKASVLDDGDWHKIRQHPELGYLLCAGRFSEIVLDGIKYHHERLDGSGYDTGLKADEIPEVAKMLAVCDSFDAMTTSRTYRTAISREEAFAELEKDALDNKYEMRYVKLLKNAIYLHDIMPNDNLPIANKKIILPEENNIEFKDILAIQKV